MPWYCQTTFGCDGASCHDCIRASADAAHTAVELQRAADRDEARVHYCNLVGVDPARTRLAPVALELVGTAVSPCRVVVTAEDNGTASIAITDCAAVAAVRNVWGGGDRE